MSTHWLSRVVLIREGRSEDVSYSVAVQRLALAIEIRSTQIITCGFIGASFSKGLS